MRLVEHYDAQRGRPHDGTDHEQHQRDEQRAELGGALQEPVDELGAAFDGTGDDLQQIIDTGFGQQYTFTGTVMRADDYRSPNARKNRKVVHDVAPDEIAPLRMVAASVSMSETRVVRSISASGSLL